MTIRDRGKIKWMAASFMPEVFTMTRDMYKDTERQSRPILDVYQTEEFDQRICYAMGENLPVKISVWSDGLLRTILGAYTTLIRLRINCGLK